MAVCNEGAASRRPASPAAAAAASEAKPTAMPDIKGIERRKPNCAPDAVASVVAPPGVIVETTTNKASGRIVSGNMMLTLSIRKTHARSTFCSGEANVRNAEY